MDPCAKTLFEGIIDYAGLFPPARLPMDEAFAEYLNHRRQPEGWMLARFVCPADRLVELAPLLEEADEPDLPVSLAILGRGGDTAESFLEAIDQDAEAMRRLAARQHERAIADVFEVRLPARGGAAIAVADGWQRLDDGSPVPVTPFFEISILDDWRPRLPAAVAAVRDANQNARGSAGAGLKIRCGGLEAAAVPDPEAVAAVIAICTVTNVPLKATQGLHHPIRRRDPALGTMVHGFLNLFVAAILARAHDLPVTRLIDIVAEEDPEAFEIGADALSWRDLQATTEQVAEARRSGLTSFGSCDFDEPRDELRGLGLLTQPGGAGTKKVPAPPGAVGR